MPITEVSWSRTWIYFIRTLDGVDTNSTSLFNVFKVHVQKLHNQMSIELRHDVRNLKYLVVMQQL